jgi:phosphoribosylformylglycinamidine synthase
VPLNSPTHLVFVEKKHPFNIEAQHLLHEFRSTLHIKQITGVRILIRYAIKQVDHKTFTSSLNTIFSEPPVDHLYLNKFPNKRDTNAFAVALLPGQFDQRADSTEQCLMLINPQSQPIVHVATVYVLEGKVTPEDLIRIKRYLINVVDSCEVPIYTNDSTIPPVHVAPVEVITNFRN